MYICISRYTVYLCMWKEVIQTWFLLKLEEMTLILSRNAKWNVHFTSIPSKTYFRTCCLVEASFWELILGTLLNILFFICLRYTFYGIMHNMSKYIIWFILCMVQCLVCNKDTIVRQKKKLWNTIAVIKANWRYFPRLHNSL